MENKFWNDRYSRADFVYGTVPNDFLKSFVDELKDRNLKVLCLAEGEGRNAVYIAKLGFDVTALDFSEEGIKKLNMLAEQNNVNVNTICIDITKYKFEENAWDLIVCVFGHFHKKDRQFIFDSIYKSLKPNGLLLMELYHQKQLEFKTGGPQSEDLLYDEVEFDTLLNSYTEKNCDVKMREIHEGEFHNGNSCVIQVIAKK